MVNISKKFIFTLSILILGLGLFGCVKQSEEINQNEVTTNNNLIVNIEDGEEIDTSDWETYQTYNSSLLVISSINQPFKFKYPESWFIHEGGINDIGLIWLSSYPRDKVLRGPQNNSETLIMFEVGHPKTYKNFIANLSLEEWCKNDLLSATIHQFEWYQENLKILDKDEEVISGQLVPFISYNYGSRDEIYKTLCFGINNEIQIINYTSVGKNNEEIYKSIISSIEFKEE